MIAMGQNPSDDEVFHLVALVSNLLEHACPLPVSKESSESAHNYVSLFFLQVDQDGSKEIEYEEFIYAFRISKSMQLHPDEQDTVDAWAALGGNVRYK